MWLRVGADAPQKKTWPVVAAGASPDILVAVVASASLAL
jgi:hypothetical protein